LLKRIDINKEAGSKPLNDSETSSLNFAADIAKKRIVSGGQINENRISYNIHRSI
jgi:hypothetical protein